jgi:hypothetical protein
MAGAVQDTISSWAINHTKYGTPPPSHVCVFERQYIPKHIGVLVCELSVCCVIDRFDESGWVIMYFIVT